MNSIAHFRKCTLSDDELLRRVDQLTDLIYQNGRIPTRHIPALPNEDYDLLVGELILRFNDLKAVAEEFCERVDKGEVRSINTYRKFKEALTK